MFDYRHEQTFAHCVLARLISNRGAAVTHESDDHEIKTSSKSKKDDP